MPSFSPRSFTLQANTRYQNYAGQGHSLQPGQTQTDRPVCVAVSTQGAIVIVDVHTPVASKGHISAKQRTASLELARYPPMQSLTPETYAHGLEPVHVAIVFATIQPLAGLRLPSDYVGRGHESSEDEVGQGFWRM